MTSGGFWCIMKPVPKKKGAEDLKIRLESARLPETEVIIRGDVTGEEVAVCVNITAELGYTNFKEFGYEVKAWKFDWQTAKISSAS